MSGLLFHFCFVHNTHAEQRWYQHVGKRCVLKKDSQCKEFTPLLFFCCWIAVKQQKIEDKSYVSK